MKGYLRSIFVGEAALVVRNIECLEFLSNNGNFKVIIRMVSGQAHVGYDGDSESEAYRYRNSLMDDMGISVIAQTNEEMRELGLIAD